MATKKNSEEDVKDVFKITDEHVVYLEWYLNLYCKSKITSKEPFYIENIVEFNKDRVKHYRLTIVNRDFYKAKSYGLKDQKAPATLNVLEREYDVIPDLPGKDTDEDYLGIEDIMPAKKIKHARFNQLWKRPEKMKKFEE